MDVYLAQHGGLALWIIAICAVASVVLLVMIWLRVEAVGKIWLADRRRAAREGYRPPPAKRDLGT